jgi:TIR domain-containing protein
MPGIFINYRRDDAPGVAGRLYDHLARKFTRGRLFIDVDAIKPGLDFVKQLDSQVSQCDALLAVIGPHWLTAADSKGKRRLDDTHDYVRIEIAAALKRDIPVIPVLIDGAEMPAEAELPEDLAPLARRHALELRHTRFASDADAIVTALHTVLPTTKKSWAKPIAAAAVVGLIVIGGAIWWFARPTPGTQTAETTPAPIPPAPVVQPSPAPPPPVPDQYGGLLDKNAADVPNPPPTPIPSPEPAPVPSTDAASGQLPGVAVGLGDSFDRVAASYPSGRQTTVSEKPAWWAQSQGLYFFFTGDKVLDNIRLDPPYAGSVHGIKLGDSFDDVKAKLGQPLNTWDFGDDKANLYRFGDTNVRFDVNPSGKVGTIFFMRAN